jgi:hypothetical protein
MTGPKTCPSCRKEFVATVEEPDVCSACAEELARSNGLGDLVAAVTKRLGFEPTAE